MIKTAAGVLGLALMMLAAAAPARAGVDVEFDIPDGQQVSAVQMAKALVEALETADPVQRPLLLQALARVLEMHPDEQITDSGRDQAAPVY